MKTNLKVMDHIIAKYKKNTTVRDLSKHSKLSEEEKFASLDYGLEAIAKYMNKLSPRLGLTDIRAP